MSKYINADKLCEDLMTRWKIADEKKEKEIQSIMADIVVPIVVGQPSVDVVEVVRCKGCKKHHNLKYSDCLWTDDDFYCADGERKDNDK